MRSTRIATDALDRFVTESNAIEGINRAPTVDEIQAHVEFLQGEVDVPALERFVSVVQPGAELRRREGMNVRVSNHIAPRGGPKIERRLNTLLANSSLAPYSRHLLYEHLHPFMDGNGRSGRVLWLHNMGGIENAPLGFLHHFYYQTLSANHLETE